MDLNVIKRLAEKRVGGLKKLAADIGMSEANLHRCINNNKMQGGDLEQIASIFGVSVDIFFDANVESHSNNVLNLGKIKAYIEDNDFSLTSLASKMNISRIALENLLNGADVKVSTIGSLAKVLGVNVADLFDNNKARIHNSAEAPSIKDSRMYEELIALRAENKLLREIQGINVKKAAV